VSFIVSTFSKQRQLLYKNNHAIPGCDKALAMFGAGKFKAIKIILVIKRSKSLNRCLYFKRILGVNLSLTN